MNTGDLLTVKEFAAAAGVSKQRIYKLMVDSLQPYTIKQENGYTLLKAEGLKLFGMSAELKPFNPIELKPFNPELKPCNDEQTQTESGKDPETVETFQPYRVETLQQSVIDTQAAEIETLKQQLQAKDQQISLLQAHTADQQKTIDSLTAALTAAQTLQALEKQERLQLQGDTQPGGDQSEAGKASAQTEGTPKRGLFARIRAAWSKPPRG